ncbi:PilZ domain-containing protein [Soehngenia longivitae]|uniref:PilZ domain-containing protein n=1 Tax=Soehngenia longivitae TaxID=2562294 RepID=A0A4Z0D317_9FIRM|nr:PilZ domain-containing protein [Soehngenia longivitae]TFZ39937.1 PilZ domain-containing protein [Soehngenia longivitae]
MIPIIVNSSVELTLADNEIFKGLIYDIVDDNIYVTSTSDSKDFKLIKVGEKVSGIANDGVNSFSFDAIVSERKRLEFPTYILSDITNIKKIQRRQYARVNNMKEIRFSDHSFLLKKDDLDLNLFSLEKVKEYLKEGLMIDLSGGGMKFKSDHNLSEGENIVLYFQLEGEQFALKGNIVHRQVDIIKDKALYSYGVQFTDITDNMREKLIKKVFVLMRKNKIKG